MNKEQLKELLKEIKNDNLYDYVSKKGYMLTKEDLIIIIKELSYAVYVLHDRDISNKVNNTMIENLKDREMEEL